MVTDWIPVAKVPASVAQATFDGQRTKICVVAWRPRGGR